MSNERTELQLLMEFERLVDLPPPSGFTTTSGPHHAQVPRVVGDGRPKVLVDAKALYEVLMALNGPPHLMRELQVTKGALFPDNSITVLTNSYNEAVAQMSAEP